MKNRPGYLLVLNWPLSNVGGVTEQFLTLARRIQNGDDYQPQILIPDSSPASAETWLCDGQKIPILSLRMRVPWIAERQWRSALAFLLTLPATLFRLGGLFRHYKVQVVNPHFPGLSCLYFVLLKRLGLYKVALILTFHGADLHAIRHAKGIERRLWAYILRSVDFAVTCAASMAEQLRAFEPRASIQVIHNGVNPTEFARQNVERYPFPSECKGKTTLLNIGKFEHKKAQDVLLEAFPRIKSAVPNAHLLLVGATGPVLANVQQRIKDLSLQECVSLYENYPHDRMASLFAGARLFILPSRREGFPVTLLEAGICGTPVVATAVDGVPELITDGVHGRLINPDDSRALADIIIELLQDPLQSQRLANNLRQRVLGQFTPDQVYAKYMKLSKNVNT